MRRFAEALDAARLVRSRLAKEDAVARALASVWSRACTDEGALTLPSVPGIPRPAGVDEELLLYSDDGGPFEAGAAAERGDRALATATRLASGRLLPVGDSRLVSVGYALLMDVAAGAVGFPADVIRDCARVAGDLGEAFGLLARRDEGARGAEAKPGLSMLDVRWLIGALASTGVREEKRRLLAAAFARASWLETKYLAKALLGSVRIGANQGVLEAAIAKAFGRGGEEVRRAAALVTDQGELAVLARRGELGHAELAIGRPIAFMLATPLEGVAGPVDPRGLVVEDKIDGVRAQLHKAGGEIAIFARGLERMTDAFPEIVAAAARASGDFALDGELVALGPGGRPRPFQALQARLRRTCPPSAIVAATPVTFVAYDLLATEGGSLLARPWSERRRALETLLAALPSRVTGLAVHPSEPLPGGDAPLEAILDPLFARARARGQEGLMLKQADAPYEAGRRGQAWIKVKRAFATLDCVITAAEEGTGRWAGILHDYTFAVWQGGALVNVGKAYSGLSDLEVEALAKRLRTLVVERHGGFRLVRPEIVVAVAFDGLQRSKRHKSGFALRFPRIARLREDKRPEEADSIEAVAALFAKQVASGHREEAEVVAPRPARSRAGPARPGRSAQLSLFERITRLDDSKR